MQMLIFPKPLHWGVEIAAFKLTRQMHIVPFDYSGSIERDVIAANPPQLI